MMAASLGVGRIATPDTYQRLVCMIFTLAAIIDTFPILHSAHQLVNETGAVTAPSTSSWSHEPIGTARACYWHATITDVCTYALPRIRARTPQKTIAGNRACPLVSLSG
jgi:hypothetical protein